MYKGNVNDRQVHVVSAVEYTYHLQSVLAWACIVKLIQTSSGVRTI